MYAHKTETRITENHRVTIELPANFPEGEAEIIVLAKSPQPAPARSETLIDFLDWLKTQPPSGRSRQEIDAQIAEERAAWGDD